MLSTYSSFLPLFPYQHLFFPRLVAGQPLDFPSEIWKTPKTDVINMFKSIFSFNNGLIYSPSGFPSKINDTTMKSKLPTFPDFPFFPLLSDTGSPSSVKLYVAIILLSPFPPPYNMTKPASSPWLPNNQSTNTHATVSSLWFCSQSDFLPRKPL